MSKRGYTEVNFSVPLIYEHRMKVNDFVNVMKSGEIKSKLLEIFPGKKVYFVITQLMRESFQLKIVKTDSQYARITGNVRVDIDGNVQTKAFGAFRESSFGVISADAGPFSYSAALDQDKKATLKVLWTLYLPQPPSVFDQQEAETPASMMIQESLSVVGRTMMLDVSSADLIIKCGSETFRAHKVVLCSRLVLTIIMFQLRLLPLPGLRSSKP